MSLSRTCATPGLLAGLVFVLAFCPLATASGQVSQNAPPGEEQDQAWLFSRTMLRAFQKIDEEHVAPAPAADMVRWSVQGLYRAMKKPLPQGMAQRLAKLDRATKKEMGQLLHDARAELGVRKELAEFRDLEICLREIFAQMEPVAEPDRRSCYYDPEVVRPLNLGGGGPPRSSLGLKLATDPTTGMLRVVTPLLNSPAYKGGIQAGDVITHIQIDTNKWGTALDQPQVFSTKGMSVERAEELFLGTSDTRVKLTVLRAR